MPRHLLMQEQGHFRRYSREDASVVLANGLQMSGDGRIWSSCVSEVYIVNTRSYIFGAMYID